MRLHEYLNSLMDKTTDSEDFSLILLVDGDVQSHNEGPIVAGFTAPPPAHEPDPEPAPEPSDV